MAAIKYLKINDAITDPNTGNAVSGICVKILAQESQGKEGVNNLFGVILSHYFSEAALENGRRPLSWGDTLDYRVQISCTDDELAGLNPTPKYAQQLFYEKVREALLAKGYTDVVIVNAV